MAPIGSTHEEYDYRFDSTNSKIAIFDAGAADAGDEVAASTSLASVTTTFIAFGA